MTEAASTYNFIIEPGHGGWPCVYDFMCTNRGCWFTIEQVHEGAGISRKAAYMGLQSCERMGMLEVKLDQHPRGNKYRRVLYYRVADDGR